MGFIMGRSVTQFGSRLQRRVGNCHHFILLINFTEVFRIKCVFQYLVPNFWSWTFLLLVPSQSPQNVSASSVNSNSFQLNWVPVPQEFANGRIQGYRVRIWEVSQWIAARRPNKTTVDNSTTSALIGGLEAYTNYVVQISAFTAAGEGNITHINVSTQEGGK